MRYSTKRGYLWAGLRIILGLIFLWAFFDKLIGLGFSTCLDSDTGVTVVLCDNAWIKGGSPTFGFLSFGTKGPFADFFKSLAGLAITDWLFMLGLLGIGIGFVLGIAVRISSIVGIIMMLLMWLAVLPPRTNPLIDDHLVYAGLMIGFIIVHAGRKIGLGNWWHNLSFVRKHKWLE